MNSEEIHVSNVEDIKDAFVITELPYNHLQYKQTALHLIDQLYGVVGRYSDEWLGCCRNLLCGYWAF